MSAKPSERSRLREPLTRERIELAALDLIEAEGLAGFSTRKLAGLLGCEAMSIYHHFPSKAHLLDALIDRVVGRMLPPPAGLPFRERLRHSAQEYRRVGLDQPAFFSYLAIHRMNTATGLCWLNRLLDMFHEAGFDDETAARTFRVVGFYLTGAILDETNGYAKGPSAQEPVASEDLVTRFPAVAAAGRYFQADHFARNFEAGLDIMLDGAEQALHRCRTKP